MADKMTDTCPLVSSNLPILLFVQQRSKGYQDSQLIVVIAASIEGLRPTATKFENKKAVHASKRLSRTRVTLLCGPDAGRAER
jgi:hypothetical protein